MVKDIGILDPHGKNLNPLNGEKYRSIYTENEDYQLKHNLNNYQAIANGIPNTKVGGWVNLKVYSKAREIIKQIQEHQVLIIESGTGTGKTVILPKLALHALDYKGKVVVTVPKINLAFGNAKYAAKCLDVELGAEVGFQHRGAVLENETENEEGERVVEFKKAESNKTKLLFSTDGMLRAQINSDPYFKKYNLVMIDEAHERNTSIDMLILRLREALLVNDNLKVIITSATLDMKLFINYFREKGISVATNSVTVGENKPVKLEYHGQGVTINNVDEKAVELFFNKIVKPNKIGDTIIFANSEAKGRKMCEAISRRDSSIYCLVATAVTIKKDPQLEAIAQEKYLYREINSERNYTRKVIIATDVWESSITLPELIFVIDNGLTLSSGYDGEKMESYLLNTHISRSQATQRKGRAGRVFPGFCYRMYDKKVFDDVMQENSEVDIETKDFTEPLLDLWMKDEDQTLENLIVTTFRDLLTKPPATNIRGALQTLYALGLTTGYMGRTSIVSDFGVVLYERNRSGDVRLTKALYYAKMYDCFYETVILAAILSVTKRGVSDIFESDKAVDKRDQKRYINELGRYKNKYGDFFAGYNAFQSFIDAEYRADGDERSLKRWCYKHFIHYKNCKDIADMANKLSHFRVPKEALEVSPEEDFEFKSLNDKIIFCLMKGLYTNMAVKKGEKRYENLFPPKRTKTIISPQIAQRATFFTSQLPSYILYWELKRLDSGVKFGNCVTVPTYLLEYLSDFEKDELRI